MGERMARWWAIRGWREAAWLLLVVLALVVLDRVVLPCIQIIGLDFRAAAESQRVAIRARLEAQDFVVAWADFALRYLALPWLAVVTAGALLKARARLVPGSWTFGDGPTWMRWLIALLVLPPLVLSIIPLAAGLSIWLCVEALVWFVDQDFLRPVHIVSFGIPVLASGLAVASVAALRWSLRPTRSHHFSSATRRWGKRALSWLIVLPIAALNLLPGVLVLKHAARIWPARLEIGLYEDPSSTALGSRNVARGGAGRGRAPDLAGSGRVTMDLGVPAGGQLPGLFSKPLI